MNDNLKSKRPEFTQFGEHFDHTLRPYLSGLEGERKTRFTIGIIIAIVLLPIALLLSWYLVGLAPNVRRDGQLYILAVLLPFILPSSGFFLTIAKIRKKTKLHLTGDISEFLGWQHSRPKNISKDKQSKELSTILYSFGAFPKHHFVQTDDILHGFHERWAFGLREITLSKRRPWSRSGPEVVFRGLVLSFAVERRITGEAIITRSLYQGHPRKRPTIRHEGIIDSPEGRITIRASNERIIRTLLCSRFQRAIIEFDAKMPGTDLSCVLYNNELHIPMTNENLFEVDWLVDSMDSKIRVQKMLDEFSYVLELLDVFLKPRKCNETGETQVPEFRYFRH